MIPLIEPTNSEFIHVVQPQLLHAMRYYYELKQFSNYIHRTVLVADSVPLSNSPSAFEVLLDLPAYCKLYSRHTEAQISQANKLIIRFARLKNAYAYATPELFRNNYSALILIPEHEGFTKGSNNQLNRATLLKLMRY